MEKSELYITAMYFTVTTILTVGYGDILPFSKAEKLICIFLMVFGVISFSFATGTLSSLITSIDDRDSMQKQKIVTLNQLKASYKLDVKIFNKLVRNINYDHSQNDKQINNFMNELPKNLRQELTHIINFTKYSQIKFFSDKDSTFLEWIQGLLVLENVEEDQYLYRMGQPADKMFFIVNGQLAYIIPRFSKK